MNNLTLQIVPGSEPIEGTLRAPDGTERTFTGTLGLLAAIEALRPQDASRGTGQGGAKDFGTPT